METHVEAKQTHSHVFVVRLANVFEDIQPFQVEERPASGEVSISISSGETVDLVQLQAIAKVLGTDDIYLAVRFSYDAASLEVRARSVAYPKDGGCGCWWCLKHAK